MLFCMNIFVTALLLFIEVQRCRAGAGVHLCSLSSRKAITVDKVPHNNSIKLREIQQRVTEGSADFAGVNTVSLSTADCLQCGRECK